jgi:hypothetical protein
MGGEAVGGGLMVVLVLFAILVLILWVLLPFAVFGTKPLLREVLAELKTLNAALTSARTDPEKAVRTKHDPDEQWRT